MTYVIKGNFSGDLCCDCHEALQQVLVKVYLPQPKDENAGDLSTNPKHTPQLLDEKQIVAKKKHLVGKGKTNPSGDYEIKLSKIYNGGPVIIDIEVPKISNKKSKEDRRIQFTVRKLQPVWRKEGGGQCYSWNYRFPYQFWGSIRSLFDVWVICGYVKWAQDRKTPLPGIQVSAYDTDWLKDDNIGSGTTDSTGHFRIDYSSSDFKKTFLSPMVNIETPLSIIRGPGVYFKVRSAEGKVLFDEDRSFGKKKERRNIPQCYCIHLYVAEDGNKDS